MKIDSKLIQNKKEKLKQVAINLKKKFIGIDGPIDKLIQNISVWYIMPELQTRPLVVALWGLTGVGKTDLVRSLVKELEKQDKFVEIQMDNSNNASSEKIKHYLERTSITPNDQAVLLLDEIQRFRTVENEKELQVNAYKDVWMLLSDGKFQSSSEKKMDLMRILLNDLFYYEQSDNDKNKKESEYQMSFWAASTIKSLIDPSDSVGDIMKWDHAKKTIEVTKALKNNSTFEGTAYSKLLIVISGNLDEAYSMSADVDNADVDADVFHEFSKKINLITIKNALLLRFKPEQIARFGNNHIIYPSLSRCNYETIIKLNIDKFVTKIVNKYGLVVKIDDSVYKTIYDNGIFPSQGVRPVLSTISGVFENYLPYFIFDALENNEKEITISFEEDYIRSLIGGRIVKYQVQLPIDSIKKAKSKNQTTLISVHEAGHAVAYAILFGIPPVQIKSSTSMINTEGFVGVHMKMSSKQFVLDDIAISLAGQVAEELVFGDSYKSTGSSGDIKYATMLASNYVRSYGFDNNLSKITTSYNNNASIFNTSITTTNESIEILLKEGKVRARDVLNKNLSYFKAITTELLKIGEIKTNKFIELSRGFGIDLKAMSPDQRIIHSYENKWKKFIK